MTDAPALRARFLRRLAPLLAFMLGFSVLSAVPADAEIDDLQRTNWGLAYELPSRVVDRFDSLGWAVEEVGGRVFAGGKFRDVTNGGRTERQPYLASFRRDGTWISSFRPDVGGTVLALEPGPDGSLFVGGAMDEWNGQNIGALAKIDPVTGELWPGFTTRIYGGTSAIRDLSMGPDGFMYAAGSFTRASSNGRSANVRSVVRFDPLTGDLDRSWIPQTNGGALWGVSRSYTRDVVYISGWDNVMAGNQVVGVSSTNANNVVWDDFQMNYRCCDHMYDIQASPAGTVFAVGEQHGAYLYDESDNWRLIRGHVTGYNSRYQNSNVRRGGDYQDIELSRDGRTFYASCHCWGSHSSGTGFTPDYNSDLARVNGTYTGAISSTAAYNTTTGRRDRSFDPYMSGDSGGWGVLEASDGCLWIAGGINAVGRPGEPNQRAGRDLVRLCEEGFVDGGGDDGLDAPATCTATISGRDVLVSWSSVVGAADYTVRRSINNGTVYWRGTSGSTTFAETSWTANVRYFVEARNGQRQSDRTTCTTAGGGPGGGDGLQPVANCTASRAGGTVTVTWPSAAGAENYVIRRSVNAGPTYWRGESTSRTFTDVDRSNASIAYYVESRAADDTRSNRTTCAIANGNGGGGVQAVASCRVTVNGGVATVSWPAAPNADGATEYVVYRSTNGGTMHWRGKISNRTFQDPLRNGDITYFVDVKQGNQRSNRTTCSPIV